MAYTTIDKPTDYFNTVLYTGNGSTQTISGVGFQPDFLWFKNRDEAQWHQIYDVIRGIGSTSFYLSSNTTNAEASTTNSLTGVSSDGFSLGNNTGVNGSADNIVAWNWLASNTTASNTDGSITSSVSANTTAGFSIVSYTGTGSVETIGHGLGTTPAMIILKNRTISGDYWHVYHQTLGGTKVLYLQTTDAVATTSASWNNTNPTSTVFTNGSSTYTNSSEYIAYCFAEKKGYSKFGSYTGNGNADGTFVYTGFKPAMIIFKNTTAEFWNIFDNKRDPFNEADAKLYPNGSNAEASTSQLDFVSNGFKLRSSEPEFNQSGTEIIYMAFAENPFVTSGGIPTTAR